MVLKRRLFYPRRWIPNILPGATCFKQPTKSTETNIVTTAECDNRSTQSTRSNWTRLPCVRRKAKCGRQIQLLTFGLGALAVVGCDTTGDVLTTRDDSRSGQSHLVAAQTSPRTTLEHFARAYQRLTAYEDEAYVRLRYELDGKLLEDRAPLTVAWDNRGHVGLQVYSVQAGPTQGRWRLSLRDDDDLFPNQVLSRALPAKVDFGWLLTDPIVAERLSAGLAGFPPQLDLLLNPQPLSGLIDDSAALSYLPTESIDNRACFVIQVQRGPTLFVLWIDQASLMLRRMRMPQTHLTEQMLADKRVANIELTIEFSNIRTEGTIDWGRFTIPEKPEAWLVNRFVPRPPAVDTTAVGEQIPGFQLESPMGQTVFSSSDHRTQRKATVLLWLADHPTCRLASEQLQRVAQALEQQRLPQGSVEIISVWAEPQPPVGSTFQSMAADWNLPGKMALDRQALGRDLFRVLEAPTLVVIDNQNRLQLRESRSNPVLDQVLPRLLSRIVAGENLAEELIAKEQLSAERFEAELRLAAASDSHRSDRFPAPRPYAPETFRLRELAREAMPHQALAVATDQQQTLWILLRSGQLQQISNATSPPTSVTHNTTWRPEERAGVRLDVGPDCQNIAMCWTQGNQIALYNVATQQSRTVQVGDEAKLVDMQWLTLGSPDSTRLAAITRDGQTVLIDPSNREQLSGQATQQTVAVLSRRTGSHSMDGLVVMADGTIENLQLSGDALPNTSARLNRPAAVGALTADSTAAAPETLPRANRLAFQPDVGPWQTWRDATQELTLARGWLASDEPAVFLLDSSLQRRWHYRMPVQSPPAWTGVSSATDPRSGQPVWAISTTDHTVHVLRADGLLIDHFRPELPVVGLSLLPNGARLELILVHPDERIRYALDGF
jgi:hypothetical protein